jgi:hypothetical protein
MDEAGASDVADLSEADLGSRLSASDDDDVTALASSSFGEALCPETKF